MLYEIERKDYGHFIGNVEGHAMQSHGSGGLIRTFQEMGFLEANEIVKWFLKAYNDLENFAFWKLTWDVGIKVQNFA